MTIIAEDMDFENDFESDISYMGTPCIILGVNSDSSLTKHPLVTQVKIGAFDGDQYYTTYVSLDDLSY